MNTISQNTNPVQLRQLLESKTFSEIIELISKHHSFRDFKQINPTFGTVSSSIGSTGSALGGQGKCIIQNNGSVLCRMGILELEHVVLEVFAHEVLVIKCKYTNTDTNTNDSNSTGTGLYCLKRKALEELITENSTTDKTVTNKTDKTKVIVENNSKAGSTSGSDSSGLGIPGKRKRRKNKPSFKQIQRFNTTASSLF